MSKQCACRGCKCNGPGQKTHLFLKQGMKFGLAVLEPSLVTGIYNPDEPVCLLKVVSPIRPQRLLSSHVPKVQRVPVVQRMDVCTRQDKEPGVWGRGKEARPFRGHKADTDRPPNAPVVFKGLDVKAERWHDCADVVAVELSQDGGLSSIVQSPVYHSSERRTQKGGEGRQGGRGRRETTTSKCCFMRELRVTL